MKLLSIKQVADKLGYTRQYIWMLIKMSRLEAQKVGETYVISETDLNNFIISTYEKSGDK